MSTGDTPLNAQEIKSLYRGAYDCWFPSCDVQETRTIKFKTCSRCHFAKYCSKECQKSHWKEHTVDCTAPPDPYYYESINASDKGSPFRRLDNFRIQYKPLLDELVGYALRTGFGENDDLYKTHMLVSGLEELQSSAGKTKLNIKYLAIKKVDSLSNEHQHLFHSTLAQKGLNECAFTTCSFIQYLDVDGQSENLLNPSGYCGDKAAFLNDLFLESIADGATQKEIESKDFQKLFLKKKVHILFQAINNIASGKDKELRAASKPQRDKK